MRRNSCHTAVLPFLLMLAVAGCKTGGGPIDSLSGKEVAAEKRLSTAAANAVAAGKTEEALTHYESLYARNNEGFFAPGREHQDIALNYAQLLRKTGDAGRALEVLAPFAETASGGVKAQAEPIVLNEYAAGSIELGDIERAEKILNHVLQNEDAADFHADASNLLGIVLDAQGKHEEADPLFRKALESWKGDPTSVMNNLAVCLSNQGKFDEALLMLNQALVMAPGKQALAGNIEVVQALKDSLLDKPSKSKRHKKKKKA